MSKEIAGKLINIWFRPNGTTDEFQAFVCLENSTFQITAETNTRRTNCGPKTAVTDPTFNASGTAVQNVTPTSFEASYHEAKAWMKGLTKLDYKYLSAADVANGFTEGDAVNNFGSGFFTDLTYNASAEADGQSTIDFTFTGTGVLDEYDDESPS